jgi:nuclear pore complex protein Nup85
LQQANAFSTWLVAHLADLLDKIEVVEAPEPGSEQLTLRDHFLLAYADGLLADPSLWRIAVDYLATCGEVGRARMRQIVRSVDLEEPEGAEEGEDKEMEVEGGAAAGEEVTRARVVDDVIAVCARHGLEDEIVAVCKAWSEILIGQQRYGEAVAYCVKAGDAKRIARIAERVLDEYVTNGKHNQPGDFNVPIMY